MKWKSFYNLKKSIKDTFVVYDVLNSRINKKEKLNILKEKVKYFLKLAYRNSHRVNSNISQFISGNSKIIKISSNKKI